MQVPDFDKDGWCLESGEERRAESPKTFWIPDIRTRENMKTGSLAKLIFRIEVDDEREPEATERMWVIVKVVSGSAYVGVLDNEPYCEPKNPVFRSGMLVPFSPEHIIDIDSNTTISRGLAKLRQLKSWIRNSA